MVSFRGLSVGSAGRNGSVEQGIAQRVGRRSLAFWILGPWASNLRHDVLFLTEIPRELCFTIFDFRLLAKPTALPQARRGRERRRPPAVRSYAWTARYCYPSGFWIRAWSAARERIDSMIRVRSALAVVAAGFLFALMSAGVKAVAVTQPNAVVVFFRNAFALLAMLPVVLLRRNLSLGSRVWPYHLQRSLAGLAAMYCFFYAIRKLDLASAVLLNYTLPLFMPIIAALWLKEFFGRRTAFAIVLGFCGVAFIVRPGSGVWAPAALVGLAAGCLGALAQVTIRRLTFTEPPLRIVFWFSLVSTLVSAVPLAWTPVSLSLRELLLLFGVGGVAALAQWLLTLGYAGAPAAAVGPFIYSTVVFAGGLDWLLWDVAPDRNTIVGSCLVVAGAVLVLRRSRRRTYGRAPLPPAQ
ncbi:MAG: hypothetical protein Kow00109_08470 [Acidobacteriota bacterium]